MQESKANSASATQRSTVRSTMRSGRSGFSTGRLQRLTPEERAQRLKEKAAKLKKESQEAFNEGWIKKKETPLEKIRKLAYQGGELFSAIGKKGPVTWSQGGRVAGQNLAVGDVPVLLQALRDGLPDTQTQLEGWEALKTACCYIGVEELPESHDPVVAAAISRGVIALARESLAHHLPHPGVQEQGLGALANIAINGRDHAELIREECHVLAVDAVRRHPTHAGVHEQAYAVLSPLSFEGKYHHLLIDCGAYDEALESIGRFGEHHAASLHAKMLVRNLNRVERRRLSGMPPLNYMK